MLSGHYEFLYRFTRSLHEQGLDPRRTLQTIISMTGETLSVKHGCLVTFREDRSVDHAYIIGADSTADISPQLWQTLVQRGLLGFVYHSDRIVVIRNIRTDPRWPDLPAVSFIPSAGSAVGVPLHQNGDIYGVLLLLHPEVDFFQQEDVSLLEEVAAISVPVIANALAMHAARTSDTRYRSLFDDAMVPVLLTDLRGHIVDANRRACDLLGYRRSDLLHTPIMRTHRVQLEMLAEQNLLNENGEGYFRTSIVREHDEEVPVMVRVRRIRLNGRDLIEWMEQDLSAQMELEQLRRDLTSMVYHDLRGPIQTILGSIYRLGQVLRSHENPAVLTLLQLGIQGTRQLERMVDSLLDVQRLESGHNMLNRSPVELRVLLTDAVQLVQPIALQASQRLQFEFEDSLPLMALDADMVRRVLINLLENATKYTPDGGVIRLTARRVRDNIMIKVSDSGQGIPENMRGRIFDKYSRIKYENAPRGVGLGLAFCRLAVEAHGGQIWVESVEGSGSDFIFTLPVVEVKDAAPDAESGTDSSAAVSA